MHNNRVRNLGRAIAAIMSGATLSPVPYQYYNARTSSKSHSRLSNAGAKRRFNLHKTVEDLKRIKAAESKRLMKQDKRLIWAYHAGIELKKSA